MQKIDLKKKMKGLYAASARKPVLADVPECSFLMVDGRGKPGTSTEFQPAVEALYSVGYTLKFLAKGRADAGLCDFTVMPLEGLWTVPGSPDEGPSAPTEWTWTLLLLQPDFITPALLTEAVEQVRRKKDNPLIGGVRLERFCEGISVQMLHVGPYEDENFTVSQMHRFAAESGDPSAVVIMRST